MGQCFSTRSLRKHLDRVATHIFDRMDPWATELAHVLDGRISLHSPLGEIQDLPEFIARGDTAPLLSLVEGWLEGDAGR